MGFLKRPSPKGSLLKMGGTSFFIHVTLIAFLSLNPWPSIINPRPTAYTVTLMPVLIQEPEIQKTEAPPVLKEEILKPIEKTKPIEKPKKDDIVEKVKKPSLKDEVPLKRLQDAIEEIRKKAAIDEIQKRVARRERIEEKPMVANPNVPITASPKRPTEIESKWSEYYSLLWAKIKESWTIPENLLKEKVDLEAIIVLIIDKDGKIKRSWFEKKSGNDLYDQRAMRAIKKAEPLPLLPSELNENTLEVGIRFFPD
jgi:colicin import membrane protein